MNLSLPAVRLTANQERQLQQLQKYNPALFAETEAKLLALLPKTGDKIVSRLIAEAMTRLLEETNKPPARTAPGEVVCDLIITSKKYGYGSTTTAEAPILWWKQAGKEQDNVYDRGIRISLVDAVIQKRLEDYELIKEVVSWNEIRRLYRKIK